MDKSLAMRHSECMRSLLSNQRFRLARHSSIQFFKVKRGLQLFPHKRDISNDVNYLVPNYLPFTKVTLGLQLSTHKRDIS